ncbi:MAG: glycosyltransferase [Clostridia bacterium]|nr:glycosyltransferase [Clostridia bacterium]
MKKRILVLVPNLHLGGAERTAVKTAEILAGNGNDVSIALFDSSDPVYETSVNILDLDLPHKNGKVGKTVQALKRGARVRRLKKKSRIDVCISFGPTANLTNILSGGRCKKIINIRGFASADGSFLSKFQYRRGDCIVCCSREIKQRIDALFPRVSEKTFVLYNPFDINGIRALGEEPVDDFDFSKKTVVTHGRLNVIKNHYRLIKAFSLVRERVPDVQLLIIGEGEMRGELEDLIDFLRLKEEVSLIGFRSNPFKYISKSDVYVLPSFSEGFPNALVEGMTFLPAVSVDCPSGPREILGGEGELKHTDSVEEAEYGILVKPAGSRENAREITDDDRLLARAIVGLLSDKDKSEIYRRKALERAAEFSFEKYRDGLNEITSVRYDD